jgi:alpha-L-rhamnosidase
MRDHEDDQSRHGYLSDTVPHATGRRPADPAWAVTRVFVPWYLYQHYGDRHVLREHYDGIRRYVEYWLSVADESGLVPGEYGYYGDWLAFEEQADHDDRVGEPRALFNTAYHYRTVALLARIADELGNDADADRYSERADTIATAFNDRFFDRDAAEYEPGSQAAQAVPLHFGIVPDEHEDDVASTLAETVRDADDRLMTGFLGTPALVHALADHGHADLAYKVVSQPERPGWVYMARNGATTMWERWNSDESVGSGMNSLNHSPFTHVSEFFYEVLAGIRFVDRPATEAVTVAPALVEDLDSVSASVETSSGEIAVDWTRDTDGRYDLSVTVPWNTAGTVRLPDAAEAAVTESGVSLSEGAPAGILSSEQDDGDLVLDVSAGEYDFAVE